MTSRTDHLPVFSLANFRRIDRVLLTCLGLLGIIYLADANQFTPALIFTGGSLIGISPFLALSVIMAAAIKASGADASIARVFTGNPTRTIIVASIFGTLSPFCSCGVIPIIAGLLAAGVPLAPVMAFWVSSPLMDPEMFILSMASLGWSFTLAKTTSAIGIGLLAGSATHFAFRAGLLADPLRGAAVLSCGTTCSDISKLSDDTIYWRFWNDPARRASFLSASSETGLFLTKWLTLAFILESQMTVYIPTSLITDWLGGGNWWTIPAAVFTSIPAYLNGYAAIPLMSRLIDMGMAPGAAMGFLLGGGITSIPASIAVFVLVRRAVFGWYLLLAVVGSMLAATLYQFSI